MAKGRALRRRGEYHVYCAMMEDRAWNRSLTALYDTRSYEAGLQGARDLAALTEKFKRRLQGRRYERNLIRIALLELTCLDRLDWLREYLDVWEQWRRRPLALYYHLTRRNRPRIAPFVLGETKAHLSADDGGRPTVVSHRSSVVEVHFLYLTWARKELIEAKLGRNFRGHARQEDLTDEEMRERLSRRAAG
jgi:hypothetical protein